MSEFQPGPPAYAPQASVGYGVPPQHQQMNSPHQPLLAPQQASMGYGSPPPQHYAGGQPNAHYPSHPAHGFTSWGELPQRHVCQYCNSNIVTHVHYETGGLTWLAAGGLCLLGCWLGCCLVPFYMDGLKDPIHICPNCHCVVGKKSRI
eukprot:TRINITY_DN191_c0_g1_i1.p2 TRINITY_DN191_c0_g1~~TRINITY_DN191_c0_g1_i1.p2  ORF type:complete len:148 (+),score=28.13 TRINITY_DN191_c0_g1_i1:286-729(+)